MTMNSFAPYPKINGCFVIKNISSPPKTISIFNTPTGHGLERDLLSLRGIGEADIRASLLKGELRNKLLNKEITIICSDIDLLQFNSAHKSFLQAGGIVNGLQVGDSQSSLLHYEDVELLGAVDGINTVFTIPTGVIFYDGALHKILVYDNGVKQAFLDDFFIAESGGPGTGFDTVIMTVAPSIVNSIPDIITADYYISNV